MIYLEELNSDSHLCDFVRLHNDHSITKYFGVDCVNYGIIENLLYLYLEDNKIGRAKHYAIIESSTKNLIGSIGIYGIDNKNHRAYSYCLIDKKYWGQGIAGEASSILYPYVFKELKINRIEAKVEFNNIAAINNLLKIGYTQEGILREYEYVDGAYIDVIIFSLLKSDYNENK